MFDGADPERFRAQPNSRWRRYGDDVMPAWLAEMDLPSCPAATLAVEELLAGGTLGYQADELPIELAEVFAGRMSTRFGWQADAALARPVTGANLAFRDIVERFTAPGDEVIVQGPVFPPLAGLVTTTCRVLVTHPAALVDGVWRYDAERLEQLVTPRTRLLLVVNPHNPLGRVFERDELAAIAAVAERHDLIVVADEVHADLLASGRHHVPMASLGDDVAARTITLASAVKSHNLAGYRCGVVHLGSEELARRYDGDDRTWYWEVSTPGIVATIAAWRHGDEWLDEVLAGLAMRRAQLAAFLAEQLPEVGYVEGEGTFLAWLDCSALELGEDPASFFERSALVALARGADYGAGYEHHARLTYATSAPLLSEMLERLVTAVDLRSV
ncbi:MAG: aminotransferase class I/II-fold pyridoxal phosphate-dependent enzyme [Acidimicrobiales bacterium]